MGCFGTQRKQLDTISSTSVIKKAPQTKETLKTETKEKTRVEIVKGIITNLLKVEEKFAKDLSLNTFLDDEQRFNEEFDEFYRKYDVTLKKMGLTRKEIENFAIEYRINKFIKSQMEYKEWECHKIIKDLNKDYITQNIQILTSLESFFPRTQKGVIYNITKSQARNLTFKIPKIINILNDSSLYTIQIFYINFFIEFIEDRDSIQIIANFVEKNSRLITFALNFEAEEVQVFENNSASINNLSFLLNAVKLNKNINNFYMKNHETLRIILTANMCRLLIEIIQCDNIKSFYVSKFAIPDSFFNEFIKVINNCKHLLFLGLDSLNINKQFLERLVGCLEKNTTLLGIILGGLKLDDDQFNTLKSNKNLKLIHYETNQEN